MIYLTAVIRLYKELNSFIYLIMKRKHAPTFGCLLGQFIQLQHGSYTIDINNIRPRNELCFCSQVVRILLQNGARVNISDRSGKTAVDLARSKLLLMRSRLESSITPESAKLFVEMSMLTGLLCKTLTQQRNDMEFDDLEERLRNLTTKEIEDSADNLLVDVAGLHLS